ncbi:MAG TPA: DUF371 domain-containing protein [Mycobacteriales bacterium]|nr:DUF371 domain-containing protein [Mycobacteriales bacterium]
MTLTAAGHPDVTGRHDKTLELTAEDAITARATCILGVSAGPLPGDLPLLRGRVALTLTAGGWSETVQGEVNPAYTSDTRLVVRRSGQCDPDTFLVHADRAAADLPRELIDALAGGAELTVTVAESRIPDRVVLVVTGGPAPAEIERLAGQADLVVDLTPRGAPAPPVPIVAPRVHKVPADVDARTVLVLARDPADALPLTTGARVVLWPPVAGADLLLSAGRPPYPLLLTGPGPSRPTGPGPSGEAGVAPSRQTGPGRPGARSAGAVLGAAVVVAERPAEIPAGWTAVADTGEVGWGVRAGGDQGPTVLIPPARDALAVDPAELARLLRRTSSGRDTAAVLTALGLPRNEAYRLASDGSDIDAGSGDPAR